MGGWEEGRKGGREGGWEGDATLNSLGSGWFRFREWFVFALGWMDGWSVRGCRLVCLAGLVWSGLVWSGCTLVWGRSCYSFCSVCLIVRFVLYAVYSIQYSFCLVFARFLVLNLRWETLN